MKNDEERIFPGKISRERIKDSGMALVLILLIIGLITDSSTYFILSAAFLLVNMIFPLFFYPFAFIWLGFSEILGRVMSKIILLLVYLAVVLPVAFIRRLLGKDTLLLRKFKDGKGSVMVDRRHDFQAEDLEKPF